MAQWVQRLCAIASIWKTGNASIRQLFERADPDLSDRNLFVTAVTERLRRHPDLIDNWSGYSADRRGSPAPYFRPGDERTRPEVGFFGVDCGYVDVTHHADAAESCADYLYREANWVLRGARVS